MSFQTVSVIGLGYIGLPTAAVVASRGVKVIGVDVLGLRRPFYLSCAQVLRFLARPDFGREPVADVRG